MQGTVLTYARDVHDHFNVHGSEGLFAELRGLISKRKNSGKTQFIELVDVTGKIQVLLLAEHFSDEDYETRCRSLRKGDIISVRGRVEPSSATRTTSVIPTDPPKVVQINADNTYDLENKPYLASGTQIVQALIVQRIEEHLRAVNFLKIEPKLMSAEWKGNGLEPLRAEYPGFGHNVYLVPSPLPQLFEALIATGYSSIFATSKCLSTSYRDEHSSNEATTIFAVERRPVSNARPLPPVWATALSCLAELFSGTGNALPSVSKLFERSEYSLSEGDWPHSHPMGHGLTIQRIRKPQIPKRFPETEVSSLTEVVIDDFARIVLEYGGKRYTLAECTLEVRFDALRVATTTIYSEHLLSLFSTAPFRSLRTSTFWNE